MTYRFMTEVISHMKTIQIKLADDVHRRAKTAAYQASMTLADLIRRAIEESVERLREAQACPESGWRLQ